MASVNNKAEVNVADKVAETASDETTEAVRRGVDGWVDSHLRNSEFSRDTPAWNRFQEGLPGLIEAVVKEVKGA